MKTFNILFLFIFFVNCSSIKNDPIVDYNIKSNNNYRYYDLESVQNKETVILIDKKEVSLVTLKKYLQEDRIKTLNIIKDTLEIKKLNYPIKKIKEVIIASKK